MSALRLILLLLASSRYLVHPTDAGVRDEKTSNEGGRNQNNVLPSVAASVKDVLAQTGGNANLPCRFTGPGIIQTEPVQQRFVRLSITEAYSTIPGGPDLHVKQGSSLRLECQLMASTETPSFIFWYREGRMINYDDEPGVRVEATKNGSILVVDKVKLSHGANYTCSPSNARAAYIMIHVIEEEEKPAAMHGGDRRNGTSRPTINVVLIFLTFLGVQNFNRGCAT
uniref:uncharacterized protein LOC117605946 isoform X2 n=1 Tax=Osmia lignaria TaxID=473952 RepID=UPI0014793CBF|nr:uncharacterized protein LOC117605946 isoform X2 [Osmia lignaria]